MDIKPISLTIKTIVITTLLLFASSVQAEYYLSYGEPYARCGYPCKVKYKKHRVYHQAKVHKCHHKKRSWAKVYTYKPYACPRNSCFRPAYNHCYRRSCVRTCTTCYRETRHVARVAEYVSFEYRPTTYRGTFRECDYETYDMRTGDDDVMYYPDVNYGY